MLLLPATVAMRLRRRKTMAQSIVSPAVLLIPSATKRADMYVVGTLDRNEKRQLEGQIPNRVLRIRHRPGKPPGPQLAELLKFARQGDTVVVHSVDRLARNLDDLRALVQA